MKKPIAQLSPEEKARRLARAKAEAELEGDLPVFLGNPNSLFLARPLRRRKPAARKVATVTA